MTTITIDRAVLERAHTVLIAYDGQHQERCEIAAGLLGIVFAQPDVSNDAPPSNDAGQAQTMDAQS